MRDNKHRSRRSRRWRFGPPPQPVSGLIPTGDWRSMATRFTQVPKRDLLFAVNGLSLDDSIDSFIFHALMSYNAELAYRRADRDDFHLMRVLVRVGLLTS